MSLGSAEEGKREKEDKMDPKLAAMLEVPMRASASSCSTPTSVWSPAHDLLWGGERNTADTFQGCSCSLHDLTEMQMMTARPGIMLPLLQSNRRFPSHLNCPAPRLPRSTFPFPPPLPLMLLSLTAAQEEGPAGGRRCRVGRWRRIRRRSSLPTPLTSSQPFPCQIPPASKDPPRSKDPPP